jgi:hypothetical protein
MNTNPYKTYFNVDNNKTALSTQQLKALREEVIRGIDFIETNKYQLLQVDYGNLFDAYQHILNTYNQMIDRNMIQSKFIDPRVVVQTQPIIDGPPNYNIKMWEKQFTVNNLCVVPDCIPPTSAYRKVKDYNKQVGAQNKQIANMMNNLPNMTNCNKGL